MHALMVTFPGKLLRDLVYIPVMNTRLYTPFREMYVTRLPLQDTTKTNNMYTGNTYKRLRIIASYT